MSNKYLQLSLFAFKTCTNTFQRETRRDIDLACKTSYGRAKAKTRRYVDADLICHLAKAKQTRGSAGPSGLNAHAWRKLCCSFRDVSDDPLASVARRLCTQHVDLHPSTIASLQLVCRLIALNKNPGARPIGVCEVPRSILAKAIILYIVRTQR